MVGKPQPTVKDQKPGKDDEDLPMYYDKGKARLIDKILLSNKLRVGLVLFVVAVAMPLLVYGYIFDVAPRPTNTYGSCNLRPEYRIPCMIGRTGDISKECSKIGCCWEESTSICHHSIPSIFEYLVDSTDGKLTFNLKPRTEATPLGNPTKSLSCHFETVTENHLRIVIIESGAQQSDVNIDLSNTAFNATVYSTGFSVEINRTATADDDQPRMLMSTSRGPLIASDNYWEVTLQLPTDGVVYGLGRLHLARSTDNPIIFYNSDQNTGSHPVIVCIDKSGKAHGIHLENKGPMEVHFMKDSNLLIVRSLSNEGFKINLFAGPTPKDVMRQLTDLIGRPKLPPYWALGLHICRDSEFAIDVQAAVSDFLAFRDEATTMGLPFDSHCVHERLMDGFTIDVADGDLEAVRGALASLGADGKKYLMSMPAPVASGSSNAFTSAVEMSVLVRNADVGDDGFLEGLYRDKRVVYPDWESVQSETWLGAQLDALQARLGADNQIAGIVLQENWPPNEENYEGESSLVYIPPFFNGSLSNGTLWWQARHAVGTHSEVHNVYGLHHSAKTSAAWMDNSSLLLTGSTFPGVGQYAGALHQREANVPASWSSLKEALTSVLGLGLAGVPLASGGSVCGNMPDFDHAEHEALCLKWYLLSISLPMIRVSSVSPYRDPTSLSSGFTRKAVLNALKLRYTMLPHYFTTFHEAMLTGTPVARAMFLEYPEDKYARYLDEQFMVGSALLVAPVLVPGAINVQVYLPQENATWYRLVGGKAVNNGTGGHIVTISTLETEALALLRGGYVLPLQAPGASADLSRANPYHLVVGLQCAGPNMDPCTSLGHLYFGHDDASTSLLNFEASRSSLAISNLLSMSSYCGRNETVSVLDNISVFGYWRDEAAQGGSQSDRVNVFNELDSVMEISNLGIDLCAITEDRIEITW